MAAWSTNPHHYFDCAIRASLSGSTKAIFVAPNASGTRDVCSAIYVATISARSYARHHIATKKEGLFLSRLHDQGGRLAISGNKYDRLVKAGYVLSEEESFKPGTVHLTLTATGRGALEIHEKKARGFIHSPPKRTSGVT
jgi:hypothetical protein